MKISWFTVIAQAINFLILVWLLKRYLYKPVLKAIDEREKKIVAQLKEAEVKKAEAGKERDEFIQKNETLETDRQALMNKAIAETEEVRKKLLEEARNEANALRSRLEKSLEESQENMNREIRQKIQQEVFAITKKTLSDLASMSLEDQAIFVFIKRLNELKEDEKKQFISAFQSTSEQVTVKSAFELPSAQQIEIQQSVNEILGAKTQFLFKTTPELISGIELSTNGYKLSWSISAYLDSLEKSITETIKESTTS